MSRPRNTARASCALLVYLHYQQLLPANRVRQLCEDLFGQPASEAVLFQATQRCFGELESFETALSQQLRQGPILNVDESGVRVAGKLHWLHVACRDQWTFYGVHEKRGLDLLQAVTESLAGQPFPPATLP